MVQAISPASEIEPGFHVTADSLVGRACESRNSVVLEDAEPVSAEGCPYGGLPRAIGSVAIVPVISGDRDDRALVVEGKRRAKLARRGAERRPVAALARGRWRSSGRSKR